MSKVGKQFKLGLSFYKTTKCVCVCVCVCAHVCEREDEL